MACLLWLLAGVDAFGWDDGWQSMTPAGPKSSKVSLQQKLDQVGQGLR